MSTSPAPDSPPHTRLINDLPTELKREIVEQCAVQDEKFKEWAKKQSVEVQKELKFRERSFLGRSVAALFLVDRQFNELAAPFLFQTLKASKVDLMFKCCIAPFRLHHFKILELDRATEVLRHLGGLAGVTKLILHNSVIKALFGYSTVRPFDTAWTANTAPEVTYAAIGFRVLKSVKGLCTHSIDCESLPPFLDNSTLLRTLSISNTTFRKNNTFADALCRAQQLRTLCLTSTDDSRRQRPFDLLPLQQGLTRPPPLQSLSISSHYLQSSHLSFASAFSSTLTHLSLTSTSSKTDLQTTFTQAQFDEEVFPLVTSFSLAGCECFIDYTISSIVASDHFPALRHLHYKLSKVSKWSPDDSPLAPFGSAPRLTSLAIPNLSELPSEAVDDIHTFCDDYGVTLEEDDVATQLDRLKGVKSGDGEAAPAKVASGIHTTLDYVRKRAEQAAVEEDSKTLSGIQGTLQAFEVERVTAKAWELVWHREDWRKGFEEVC